MNDENDATPIAGNVLGKDESVKEESPNTETDDDAGNHFNPIDQQVEVIVQPIDDGPRQITPGTISATKSARPGPGGGHGNNDQVPTTPVASGFSNVKKRLFPTDSAVVAITPARKRVASKECIDDPNDEDDKHSSKRQRNPESPAKRRLIFGRTTTATEVTLSSKVRAVYKIINQRTGAIGGNGCFGPIYGELTAGSMQRIINLMKEHTQFNSKSRFIDVGSGIGKPNLHTAQDPGVEISYGIESEESRWLLGMNCLQGVFDAIDEQNNCDVAVPDEDKLSCSCVFVHGNILDVETFNPFTHVYMFSIG